VREKILEISAFIAGILKYLTWGDRLLISSVLLLSVLAIPVLNTRAGSKAEVAFVKAYDQVVERLNLEKDRTLSVMGRLGETMIEVKEGRVRVLKSPGPQQICVNRGWISKPGEAIICLPNRVIIEIPGRSDYDDITR